MTAYLNRLSILGLIAAAGCAADTTADPERAHTSAARWQVGAAPKLADDVLAARARIAASGRYLASASGSEVRPRAVLADDDPCTGVSFSDALDIPADQVVQSTLTGSQAAAVRSNLGVITPLRGQCLVLLSTGTTDYGLPGSANPEPGTDLGATGTDGDKVTLRLKLRVPPGANLMSLQYNFLSAEAPDFTGSQFNDTFSVQITDGSGVVHSVDVASVNSSEFFLVSESRARGTGFDLFTPDPLGVDVDDFTGGQPDAGLTDFHVFSSPVTGGTEITLDLSIQDNGDGILDSAVLLDAVEFTSLQVVDPNPKLIIQAGESAGTLTQSTDDLVQLGVPSRGAIADGATELVLRMKVSGPGTTEFSLPDENDGGLRRIDSVKPLTVLPDVPVISVGTAPDIQFYAVAVYRAPVSFDRGPDDHALVERPTHVTARFTSEDRSTIETTVELQIRRPPVVLVRGIWTQPDDWLPDWQFADRERLNDQRFVLNNPVFSVSREDGNYSCGPETEVVPLGSACTGGTTVKETCKTVASSSIAYALQGALDNTRRLGIAATKADVVAHGTGGVRVRSYIDTGYVDGTNHPHAYKNPANLMQGDVNRLITVSTPHLGMLMADRVVQARNTPTGPKLDACLMRQKLSPIERDDVDRATTGSVSLPDTVVPSHAIVGTGGAALAAANNGFIDVIQPKLLAFHQTALVKIASAVKEAKTLYTNTFGACDQDLMVDVVSQQGGIDTTVTRGAVKTIAMTDETKIKPDENSPDSDYFRTMRSPEVNLDIADALTSRPEDGKFASMFPATATVPRCDKATGNLVQPAAAVTSTPSRSEVAGVPSVLDATGSLRIVFPTDGTVVLAGQRIRVEVASEGGLVPVTVMTSAGGPVVRSDVAPFTTEVQIPPGAIGPLRVSALAFDASGEAAFADDVTVEVRTTAVVQTVRILTQDPILYAVGEQRQLSVFGDFNDGFTRSITSGSGTVYLSSNPAVVTVSTTGVITAVHSGIATIIAQNNGAQDSITVTVKANATPVVSAGADASLGCNLPGASAPVQLDGSASFDPDGDALSFAWFENGVKLATGVNPIISLPVGVHTLDLVASDGISAPGSDTVTVSVLTDTEPPIVSVRGANPASVECAGTFSDDGATASDACDGDLTGEIVAASDVDARTVGSYTIDYQVHDHAGVTGTASRKVVVADHTPPVISVVGDSPGTTECGGSYVDTGAVASDTCDGDLTAAIVAQPHVNTAAVGSYAVDYQVHDRAGLTSTTSRPVVVVDRTPPVISVSGPSPEIAECGLPFTDPGATATDACDGDLTAGVSAVSQVNPSVPGSYRVDYQVADHAGLAASATRAVSVADHTPPRLSILGDNPAIQECGTTYHDGGATAIDLCAGELTSAIQTSSHVNARFPGIYRVDYRVHDPVGLAAAASRIVRVVDRRPPELAIAPMRQLFPPDDDYRTFDLSDCATASDVCRGPLDIDRAGQIIAIHSDEPDSHGFGHPGRDIVILTDSRFKLRNQANHFGNGRVYEIEFAVRDQSGNTTGARSCFIGVRPRPNSGPPVDDGRVVTVRPRR